MITNHIVIQDIKENGRIRVSQVSSQYFQWTFETRRDSNKTDKEYFPFRITGDINEDKRFAGAETQIIVENGKIIFTDDYGLPGGFVIGILFPKNYIPDIIKFKDKPFIPVGFAGQVSTLPPGQIQIFYNHIAKRSAIVFNIHQNICFGFKCVAIKIADGQFPSSENQLVEDFFDIYLSRELLSVDSIKNEDLKIINETLNNTDLKELNASLNEILNYLKLGEKGQAISIIKGLENKILNGFGLLGSMTTIIDSYKNGGIIEKFVGKIFEYMIL
jgi:hypothetical protein